MRKFPAISPTVCWPPRRRLKICRRVGSAIARNTVSRRLSCDRLPRLRPGPAMLLLRACITRSPYAPGKLLSLCNHLVPLKVTERFPYVNFFSLRYFLAPKRKRRIPAALLTSYVKREFCRVLGWLYRNRRDPVRSSYSVIAAMPVSPFPESGRTCPPLNAAESPSFPA
jgi:hypothetical protein